MEELGMYLNYLENNESSNHTINNYKIGLMKWFSYQQIKSFDDIVKVSSYDIEKYDTYLKQKGLSINTRHATIYPIKGFYNYLLSHNKVESNPCIVKHKLKNKKEIYFLSKEEIKIFLDNCKTKRNKALFYLLLDTGMRYCEVSSIKIDDIKYENGICFIEVLGKGSKLRTLGFSETTYFYLLDYIQHERPQCKNELLFVTREGELLTNYSINRTIKSIIKKSDLDIPLEQIHLHCLRHSFCTLKIESGETINNTQAMMGHERAETTMKYYMHVDKQKVVKRMSENSMFK